MITALDELNDQLNQLKQHPYLINANEDKELTNPHFLAMCPKDLMVIINNIASIIYSIWMEDKDDAYANYFINNKNDRMLTIHITKDKTYCVFKTSKGYIKVL